MRDACTCNGGILGNHRSFSVVSLRSSEDRAREDRHGFPVEATFVRDGLAVRKCGEVDFIGQFFEASVKLIEIWRFHGEGCEE